MAKIERGEEGYEEREEEGCEGSEIDQGEGGEHKSAVEDLDEFDQEKEEDHGGVTDTGEEAERGGSEVGDYRSGEEEGDCDIDGTTG